MSECIQSEGPKKQDKTTPGRTCSSRSLRQAGSKERRMTSVHALEQQLLEQIVTHDNLTRACDRQGWRKVEQRRSSCREGVTHMNYPHPGLPPARGKGAVVLAAVDIWDICCVEKLFMSGATRIASQDNGASRAVRSTTRSRIYAIPVNVRVVPARESRRVRLRRAWPNTLRP